jgi:hypothetical protein
MEPSRGSKPYPFDYETEITVWIILIKFINPLFGCVCDLIEI